MRVVLELFCWENVYLLSRISYILLLVYLIEFSFILSFITSTSISNLSVRLSWIVESFIFEISFASTPQSFPSSEECVSLFLFYSCSVLTNYSSRSHLELARIEYLLPRSGAGERFDLIFHKNHLPSDQIFGTGRVLRL